ncbi:hypothetical protein SELMODRAFT_417433 [Selaginella moellendorffii]|uniref:Uncharacterized protein n=1 Tax=Selaginella moellendorffii TaxID=88036 RepID=D8S274_SELML|nr:hypothetical protein SELMODRAFT_417433 [Selaginella moellendorffii]
MEIVIDGHGHILGRLASICSKELLKGQRLVIVRKNICMSGGIIRQKMKMIPRSKRAGALRNFKAYDGCPPPYGVVKKMVIPDALKVLRMRRERPFCLLGALARDLGWEGGDFVAKYDKKQNELQQQQENVLEETGREFEINQWRQQEKISEAFGELKELVIEGFEIQGEIKLIPLPSLVELNVKGFIIAPELPHPGIAWPLLTTLELFYMLSPITVNGILARCPSLTNLSMIDCIYYVDFDNEDDTDDDAPMTSAFSVELTIFSRHFALIAVLFSRAKGEIYDEIKIIAPSLKKLNLSGFQNLKLEGPFALAEMSLSEIDFEEESLSIMQEQLNSITSEDPSVTEVLQVSTVGGDSGRLYAVLRSIVGITTTVLEVQGSPALLDNIDHLQVWESIRTYARTVNLVPAEVD